MSSRRFWATARSADVVRTGLVAALAAIVALGSYSYVSDAGDGAGTTAGPTSPTVSPIEGDTPQGASIAPFTTADVGACLTWEIAGDGEISDFEQTSCDDTHRFEVSAREDLDTYPSSEFGTDAPVPDLTRQAQLREELCHTPTIRYLDGRYDPVGRYSIAPILPAPEAWAAGDRTMLCGLQSTDTEGLPVLTVGRAAEQDQARVNQPGECVFVDSSSSLRVVDCAEEHQLETTAIVDLKPVFPEGVPGIEEQDGHLTQVCTQAAMDYLGGEEALYQSTLQPYWGTIPQASWIGGSHSVNCSLIHTGGEDSFSVLQGTALDGREGITVNGQTPEAPPEREPLRVPPPEGQP